MVGASGIVISEALLGLIVNCACKSNALWEVVNTQVTTRDIHWYSHIPQISHSILKVVEDLRKGDSISIFSSIVRWEVYDPRPRGKQS